jgi:hypothetical protein
MASDVFVHWTTDDRPSREQVEMVIRDFFGDAATEIHWDANRFFVTLVGKWSRALARVVNEDAREMLAALAPESGGRYLEVFIHEDAVDIITRHQDDFTHACQAGLAAVFARRWKGRIEK